MNKTNPLVHWREKARMTREQVETLINWPTGTLCSTESRLFESIPCCQLVRLARVYAISEQEVLKEIQRRDQ